MSEPKRYTWNKSRAQKLWIWAGGNHIGSSRTPLQDVLERPWLETGAVLEPVSAVADVFCREWEEIWKSGPTEEKAHQWAAEKREKLDHYRTLAALAGDDPDAHADLLEERS